MINYNIIEVEVKKGLVKKVEYTCPVCQKIGLKQLKTIKNNPRFLYCSRECNGKHKSELMYNEMSNRVNQDFKKWLEYKYVTEQLSSREIANLLYDNEKNSPNVLAWMHKLGVPVRDGSQSVALQYQKEGRKELSRQIALVYLNSDKTRNKLRLTMQTKEYKEKSSKAKQGTKNPMYGVRGTEHPKYNPELTEYQRANSRINGNKKSWRIGIFERDNFTCKSCGDKTGGNLVAHHLNCYKFFPEQRWDIDNGITLCSKCHRDFHGRYGYNNKTTKENFEEYLKTTISN